MKFMLTLLSFDTRRKYLLFVFKWINFIHCSIQWETIKRRWLLEWVVGTGNAINLLCHRWKVQNIFLFRHNKISTIKHVLSASNHQRIISFDEVSTRISDYLWNFANPLDEVDEMFSHWILICNSSKTSWDLN